MIAKPKTHYSNATALDPLIQLLGDLKVVLTEANHFQPFDFCGSADGSCEAPPHDATSIQHTSQGWEHSKKQILEEIQQLTERLQARVNFIPKYIFLSVGEGMQQGQSNLVLPKATNKMKLLHQLHLPHHVLAQLACLDFHLRICRGCI